jgi:hypothetical protein
MMLPVFLPRGVRGTGRPWLRYHFTRWFMIPSRLSALAMTEALILIGVIVSGSAGFVLRGASVATAIGWAIGGLLVGQVLLVPIVVFIVYPLSMPQQYALMEMTKFEYRAMIIERLQSLKAQIEAPDQDHGPDTMKIVTEDILQRTVPRGVWGWTRLALVALGGLVVLNVSGRILRGPLQFAFPIAFMVVWFKVVVPRLQPKRMERSTVADDTLTPRALPHPPEGTDEPGEAER